MGSINDALLQEVLFCDKVAVRADRKKLSFQTATCETIITLHRKIKNMNTNSICANPRILLRIFQWDSYGQTQFNLLKYPKVV